MVLHRGQCYAGGPLFAKSLAALALLVACIPTYHATPLTTQVAVEMEAHHNNNKGNDSTTSAKRAKDGNHNGGSRILQLLDLGNDGGSNNATCPPESECPLCQCDSAEDDAECLLSKATEACASADDAIEKCYADMLANALPGDVDIDIEGICDAQCDGGDPTSTSITPLTRQLCRICEMLACCNECPSERAGECFPPSLEYTPPGWEPADCSGGGGGMVATAGALLIAATSIVVFGLFT